MGVDQQNEEDVLRSVWDRGATGVEYAIMAAGIAAAIIVIVYALGTKVFTSFNDFNNLWT